MPLHSAVYTLASRQISFSPPPPTEWYSAVEKSCRAPLSWLHVAKLFLVDATEMNLVSELERVADALSGDPGSQPPLSFVSVAERIAHALSVRPDEVAILGVSHRWRHLHFFVPEALKNVGFIPLSSKTALAARTTRENRPETINDFTSVKHASVFEAVKLASEKTEVIQKIISAPILFEDRVVGVIQISRKGANPKAAGPDFTADDLAKVVSVCNPLGKLLHHAIAE